MNFWKKFKNEDFGPKIWDFFAFIILERAGICRKPNIIPHKLSSRPPFPGKTSMALVP